MSVDLLTSDDTRGGGKEIQNPTWEQVKAEILEMDGEQYTSVGMMVGDDDHLMIGGGGTHYIVSVRDGDRLCAINNPNGDPERMVEVCVGEPSNFPEDELVGLDEALNAARWYFEHHTPEPNLPWKDA
ncbi:MAG: Imm1 family immunity protein [Alphaproteobacteria bacterium]|nr:Imm1 family immunity protein [Alphaproteobacteria bacterium]